MTICYYVILYTNAVRTWNITGAISLSGYDNDYRLPILITDVHCTGSETSFLNCSYNTLSNDHCSPNNDDASVVCQRKEQNNDYCSSPSRPVVLLLVY